MGKVEDLLNSLPEPDIKREFRHDGTNFLEKVQRGYKFQENGLWGLKDIDGSVIYEANYVFIGACKDYVLAINPDWSYIKENSNCRQSGRLDEKERPYVVNGKAGIKVDGEVIIPAEYDFIERVFGDTVFYAVKDGKDMYLNHEGKEVLTRVRHFDGEDDNHSPFWLCSNDLDVVTIMNYVGHSDESNPNVVMIDGQWIELERYCKDEIMATLIDPNDDLAITKETLKLFCNKFSYEYSFYVANAKGKNALKECVKQFKLMDVFCNSWYYVVKIWQAPDEQFKAQDLRRFTKSILKNAQEHGLIGTPIFAVGHSRELKPGEVRVLLVTHYHERCWPAQFEYVWSDYRRTMPITTLLEKVPALRGSVKEEIQPENQEEVFNDQLLDCVVGLKYYDGLLWDDAEKALNGFVQLGSPIRHSLRQYLSNALEYYKKRDDHEAIMFFLKAARWAFEKGDIVNDCKKKKSSLDILQSIKAKELSPDAQCLVEVLETEMLSHGAKTFKELELERNSNSDYFRELDYLRIDGTSEKSMPGLNSFTF